MTNGERIWVLAFHNLTKGTPKTLFGSPLAHYFTVLKKNSQKILRKFHGKLIHTCCLRAANQSRVSTASSEKKLYNIDCCLNEFSTVFNLIWSVSNVMVTFSKLTTPLGFDVPYILFQFGNFLENSVKM